MEDYLPEEDYHTLCKSILRRDGYRCKSCFSRNALHVHHIIFRSQQGPSEAWNLITLCHACHDGVHKHVKNGEYGLVITVELIHDDVVVTVKRNWGWKPK